MSFWCPFLKLHHITCHSDYDEKLGTSILCAIKLFHKYVNLLSMLINLSHNQFTKIKTLFSHLFFGHKMKVQLQVLRRNQNTTTSGEPAQPEGKSGNNANLRSNLPSDH